MPSGWSIPVYGSIELWAGGGEMNRNPCSWEPTRMFPSVADPRPKIAAVSRARVWDLGRVKMGPKISIAKEGQQRVRISKKKNGVGHDPKKM
jgi:hypothetical protein